MADFELIVKNDVFEIAKAFNGQDPEGIDKILNGIKAKVSGIVPDVSTAKGRKEIAALAFKVAQSKVLLVKMGKDLTAEWRVKTQKVNADCNKIESVLTALKDEVRGPLTEWELAEEARQKAEKEAAQYAADWDEAHKDHELYLRVKELERKEAELEAMKAAQKAEAERIEAERIAREKAEREAEEARQAEIARQQQAEIDAANRLAREKRIAEEAAAKAQREADQRLIDAEKKRIADLADAQAKAEAEKKALAEAQEKARIEAERKRLADIQAEKDRAEKEKQAMIEAQAKKDREAAEAKKAEQARIAAEKEADEKRQKNVAHQKKINNEALNSLVALDINLADAKRIVEAIIKGRVANVFIKY